MCPRAQGPCRRLPPEEAAPLVTCPAYRGQVRPVRRGLCRLSPVGAGPCHRRLRPPRLLPGGAGGRLAGARRRRTAVCTIALLLCFAAVGGGTPLCPAGGLYAVHASDGAPAGAGGGQAHLSVRRSHAPAAPKSLRRRVGVPLQLSFAAVAGIYLFPGLSPRRWTASSPPGPRASGPKPAAWPPGLSCPAWR